MKKKKKNYNNNMNNKKKNKHTENKNPRHWEICDFHEELQINNDPNFEHLMRANSSYFALTYIVFINLGNKIYDYIFVTE